MKKNIYGFSLIELMIVVTIMGILCSLAIPSYQNYTARARFAEVIMAAQPFKTAIALALQTGMEPAELNLGAHGIPTAPAPSKNLAALNVENGVITAVATVAANNASYVLKPNADGSRWTISGSCIKAGLCEG
jgi:prepilin-type N-terminal cleavage/methylation domain-containing protein